MGVCYHVDKEWVHLWERAAHWGYKRALFDNLAHVTMCAPLEDVVLVSIQKVVHI